MWGGITGAQESAENGAVIYDGLVNRARILGKTYVGGIVGRLKAEKDGEVLVEGCQNYGSVEASGEEPLEARYIGGITGYSENITGDQDGLIIRDCITQAKAQITAHLVIGIVFYQSGLLITEFQFFQDIADVLSILLALAFDKFIILKQSDNILFQALSVFAFHKFVVLFLQLFVLCKLYND